MQHFEQRDDEATFHTVHTVITAFISLLAVLEQKPGAAWQALLQKTQVDTAKASQTTHFGDELSNLLFDEE